ncbi:hypothetical protein LCGC14_2784630, partial [marine sediment metagenome]
MSVGAGRLVFLSSLLFALILGVCVLSYWKGIDAMVPLGGGRGLSVDVGAGACRLTLGSKTPRPSMAPHYRLYDVREAEAFYKRWTDFFNRTMPPGSTPVDFRPKTWFVRWETKSLEFPPGTHTRWTTITMSLWIL